MSWFRRRPPLIERLAAEQERTGVKAVVHWDQSGLQWVGRIEGAGYKWADHSQKYVMRCLLAEYRSIPDKDCGVVRL